MRDLVIQGSDPIGPWQIEGVLGQGATATVYAVRHADGRVGALKRVAARDAATRARTHREATLLASLHHPHVVDLVDWFWQDDSCILVLEIVRGPTLAEAMRTAQLPLDQALRVFDGILDGVKCAHDQGLVHRDLKPANVLLTEAGVPKIADFGLARTIGEAPTVTQSGAMLGTPAYMAPEQWGQASQVSAAADIFSLGAILYELTCARPPFLGETVLQVVQRAAAAHFASPRSLRPELPAAVVTAICGALHPDPAERIGSVETLREVLAGHRGWTDPRPDPAQATAAGFVSTEGIPVPAQAIVAVELAGVDALFTAHPVAAAAAVEVARDAVKSALTTVDGQWLHRDPWVAGLPSARHAARFALQVQRALLAAPWPPSILDDAEPDRAPLWRGLAAKVGASTAEGPDGMIRARRLAAAAHAGQVLVEPSLAALVGATDDLDAVPLELPGASVGLEDVSAVVQLTAIEMAARRFPSRTGGRLPAVPGPLLGRAADLGALRALLHRHPLVTLTGTGGVGKTRLAVQVAVEAQRTQRVWFCDLSSARTLQHVVAATARALDLPLRGQDDPAALESIGLALAGRAPALVVLDNVEQILDEARASVGQWMARAPGVRFLVTSRARLGLPVERVYGLAPLAIDAAVQLFFERAPADASLNDSDRDDVAAIVERIDRLPLAIELAAARVGLLSPAILRRRLSAELQARFALLRDPHATDGPHATLRGVLDWSWSLLEPARQVALAQCTVFRGGFDLDAAEAVLELDSGPTGVADALQALRDHSLLRSTRAADGRVVLSLLETVRAHAVDQLSAEDRASLSQRHATYFAQRGTPQAIAALSGPEGVSLCRQLVDARNDLSVAAELGIAQGQLDIAVPCALALAEVGLLTGPYRTARRLLERVLEVPGLSRADQARVLLSLGLLMVHMGDTDALPTLTRALSVSESLGDRRLEATAHGHLGHLAVRSSRHDDAYAHYERAHALCSPTDDPHGSVRMLACLANVDSNQSRFALADVRYAECLERFEAIGDRRGLATLHINLGVHNIYRGDLPAAVHHYELALPVMRETGNRLNEGVLLGNLASAYTGQGRRDAATECLEQSLQLYRDLGIREGVANTRVYLGELAADGRRFEEARELFEAAWADLRTRGSLQVRSSAVTGLGETELALGDLQQALHHLELGVRLARDGGGLRHACRSLRSFGAALIVSGDLARARTLLDEAEEAAIEIGDVLEHALLWCVEGQHAWASGDRATAEHHLERARARAAELELGPAAPLAIAVAELDEALRRRTDR